MAPPPTIELPKEWVHELRSTGRTGSLDRASHLVAQALEAFAAEDYDLTSELAELAKAEASRSPRVRELLGLSHYHAGRWQEASRELLTFRRMTASVAQNHVIADCYRALGRPEKALEMCGEVSRKDVDSSTWAEVVIVGAGAFADKKDLVKALAYMSRGDLEPRSVEPHHLRLWYVRADLLEKAGKKDEARQVWERIAAEDPEFFDVNERLRAGTS